MADATPGTVPAAQLISHFQRSYLLLGCCERSAAGPQTMVGLSIHTLSALVSHHLLPASQPLAAAQPL